MLIKSLFKVSKSLLHKWFNRKDFKEIMPAEQEVNTEW